MKKKQLNNLIFSFFYIYIWQSNIDKIKWKIVTQDYTNGGLRLVALECYIKGLKSALIRRLIRNDNSYVENFMREVP